MWFEALTGFSESPQQVRENITLKGDKLISRVNGAVLRCGRLETPTLAALRRQAFAQTGKGAITVREVVADVQDLHRDPANAGALFQVASQFNLLEMVSPDITPEAGVGIYDQDHTQGPACAIAAGAGTIYRNYFAPVNGQVGQTAHNQIDGLADLGAALGNHSDHLWTMRNGYAFPSRSGLTEISRRLESATEGDRDRLRSRLRIGLQWDTQVTLGGCQHLVSQAYCSALPVAYSDHPQALWTAFATLVLEAAYEATLCAGIINARRSGNPTVFLTLLGGGVFGNNTEWITGALARAVTRCAAYALDVAIVSHGRSKPFIRTLLR